MDFVEVGISTGYDLGRVGMAHAYVEGMNRNQPGATKGENMDLKKIVKTAFPDYKGRKIKQATSPIPQKLDSYWSDGYRDYWAFVRLADMEVLPVHSNHPGYEPSQPRTLRELPPGFALVCRTYAGMSQWITVWVSESQPVQIAAR